MGGFETQGNCDGQYLGGPYRPPIGCGPVDFAVPAASEWNSPYATVEPDGTAVLTPEPSTWIYVLGAALLTLVTKRKTLFH
jgi:hypothetical protein